MSNIEMMQPRTRETDPHTGIPEEHRKQLAEHLSRATADTYLLMMKTQAYHWNVVGPLFVSFHKLTEKHYEKMFEAADDLAERVRQLGFPAPGSYSQMAEISCIVEDTGRPNAEAMIENLVRDHQSLTRRLREAATHADEVDDHVTHDMLTERMEFHEKAAWMLGVLTEQ